MVLFVIIALFIKVKQSSLSVADGHFNQRAKEYSLLGRGRQDPRYSGRKHRL